MTTGAAATASASVVQALRELEAARERTLALTAFDEVELTRQHSPLMSPLVWDLAHIGQQEEHFLLQQAAWSRSPARPGLPPRNRCAV